MLEERGEGRGSFIAGPSTRNQRIKRLWRDVFRWECHLFYYMFYALEDTGLLNNENLMDLLAAVNVTSAGFFLTTNNSYLRTFALIVSAHPYCARKFACHVIHERAR